MELSEIMPYSYFDLVVAQFTMKDPKISDEELKKIGEEIDAEIASRLPKEKKEFNERVAADNGISVETLINSPNYEMLVKEFAGNALKKIVSTIAEKLQLTEKEVWASMLLNKE